MLRNTICGGGGVYFGKGMLNKFTGVKFINFFKTTFFLNKIAMIVQIFTKYNFFPNVWVPKIRQEFVEHLNQTFELNI